MFSLRICFVFGIAFVAVASCHHIRKARSPDSIQADMPGYTTEASNDDKMNEEGEYWQGEGDKQNDRYEQDRENRNKTAEQNQEDFDKEREYREDRQDKNNKELQQNYDDDKDKLEDRQDTQEEHYNNEHNNTSHDNPDLEGDSQKANQEYTDDVGSKGDRYGEKGKDEMNDREEKAQNTESPSVTYNRD